MGDLRRGPVGSELISTSSRALEARVEEAERLYRNGRPSEMLGFSASAENWQLSPAMNARLSLARAMAQFDIGDVVSALAALHSLSSAASLPADLAFSATFALLLRASDFDAPAELLPIVSRLRQLAAQVGDATSIASLHLAVARLEGLRGHCLSAHRHVEIARHLTASGASESLQCFIDLVEGSLESISGNFARARVASESCLRRAETTGSEKHRMGALTNLSVVALYAGDPARARRHLAKVLATSTEVTWVRLGSSDTLAQIELFEGNLAACSAAIGNCKDAIIGDRLPARSWYDLAHQLTRCAYLERLEEWTDIIAIADEVDPELERRQYKALRTSLICAKARALARLGAHDQAQACLARAVRTCPRGAVDPQIVLEASKGVCDSLRTDASAGARHFSRALAACRALGHRYHERWIDATREALAAGARARVAAPTQVLETADAALLLADVATILGAGHSVDLMALRTVSLLEGTPLGTRVQVASESGCEYQADPAATTDASADTFHLRLRGSDRQIDVTVSGSQTLDEMSLLKSVADIVQTAVARTTDTQHEDDEQNLWPRAETDPDVDVIFRSPRMIELRKIALRLAETDLPVLITGETGTGKEIFARLIHDHSKQRRGPFTPFNCAAVPRDLMESQLFGHRRGAFTGAGESFSGVIRAAERGTLFLDEVGDLDLGLQPKLLRFLESGEVHPLGELRPIQVPVRLVAATNADIEQAMRDGRFRRDLFYRLGAAQIALPPLRERKDEIPALASLFVGKFARECGRSALRIGDDFVAALLLYDWPGNIRELVNEIRRVVAMAADGALLGAADLGPAIASRWNARPILSAGSPPVGVYVRLDQPLPNAVDTLEQQFIEHALKCTGGRVADAATMLGISRKGLFLKRRRRGLVAAEPIAADA